MKLRISAIFTFILFWYIVVFLKLVELPYPHKVLFVFANLLFHPEPVLGKSLVEHATASVLRVLTASSIAFAVAIPMGVAMGWFERFSIFTSTVVEILRPIPPLAWIPLAYVLFSKLSNPVQTAQLFIVFIGAFFPCLISVVDAAKNTPPELIEMAKAFNANNRKILSSIVLPYSLQGIVTGIRIGLGVGWMSIVAAEMLATSGSGLGYFIMVMYEVGGRVAEIISGMMLIGIIGYTMNFLLLKLERVVMPWR
ncbi:MAG TPA: ABC transporter permease [Archaeoglobus veneficus]|nr:ABC transporter permease [Archaeoglobus veneficus]